MIPISRRSALAASLASLASLAASWSRGAAADGWPDEAPLGPARAFSRRRLQVLARDLARRPYRAAPAPPAALVRAIDYDAFGQIVYRQAATLWGEAPGDGGVRLFPLGRPARLPVAVSVVRGGEARQVLYSPALFEAPAASPLCGLGGDAGFGGFRVMNADHRTDWLAFLGASYFRSSDPFNQYGLSARGVALDVAAAAPEEFPTFTRFWLEPQPSGELTVHALLEGPSLCGAYRIGHRRSPAGLVQEIAADLHFRAPVARLGLAPLTSMYWYSRSDRTPADDWRPQIHDSDGLSIWTGAGERIWRPLANPGRVTVNAFLDHSPRGFGLMQRDRRFADYEDDGAFYDRRPSAWVEPVGDWAAGSVQLVEIPTHGEGEDNIVAFWTPAEPVRAGQNLAVRYRLHWTSEEPTPVGVARVVATRFGEGGRPGQPPPPGRRKLVVDFAGGALARLGRVSAVEPVVNSSPGAPIAPVCYPVRGEDRWRLMFDVAVPLGATIDLRAFLRRGGEALTETWVYQLLPS